MQRYPPFAKHKEIGPISIYRSLAVPVQFRDLFIAKSRQRTFVEDNQFLAVAVNSAAITVLWTPNLLELSFWMMSRLKMRRRCETCFARIDDRF